MLEMGRLVVEVAAVGGSPSAYVVRSQEVCRAVGQVSSRMMAVFAVLEEAQRSMIAEEYFACLVGSRAARKHIVYYRSPLRSEHLQKRHPQEEVSSLDERLALAHLVLQDCMP